MPIKACLVKAIVFPVVMYGCESCIIKKAECHRIDAFEVWFWRRILRIPWAARRFNQSILREISPEYSLEELMLKLQYFGHLTYWKRPWCQERLKAGGEWDDRGWDGWMTSRTQWTWVLASSRSWRWTGKPDVLQSMGSQRVGHACTQCKYKDYVLQFSSVTQSCPTLCNPMDCSTPGLPVHHQLTPRVCSNSCPLSWWCHSTISSSIVPFSCRLQSFPASGSFQMSQFFPSGGQSIGVSASGSVLPMNT